MRVKKTSRKGKTSIIPQIVNGHVATELYAYDQLNAYKLVSDLPTMYQREVQRLLSCCPSCHDSPIARMWVITDHGEKTPIGVSCDNPDCFPIIHKPTDEEIAHLVSSRS